MSGDDVTIVSGLPRSGTSMMMQMLQAGGCPVLTDGARAADPDNPRGYFEFEPVKQTARDPSWLDRAGGKAVKMVYRLLYDLPPDRRYRVIVMRRAMAEVLASQAAMLARIGKDAPPADDERMADLFRAELAAFEEWLARREGFRVLHVDYGDVLTRPLAEARRINDFLGGGLDTARMAAAVSPDLHRHKA